VPDQYTTKLPVGSTTGISIGRVICQTSAVRGSYTYDMAVTVAAPATGAFVAGAFVAGAAGAGAFVAGAFVAGAFVAGAFVAGAFVAGAAGAGAAGADALGVEFASESGWVNSLKRICAPNQPAKRSAWLVVTAWACVHPTRQTNTSAPELRLTGRAEKASHWPSAENSGARPTIL
jgi:hypothetical protein